MFRRKKAKDGNAGAAAASAPLDVVLIGCGPGGMMFLHALNKMGGGGGGGGGDNLNVTCFERASSAGGIWRDVPTDDLGRTKPENVPLMYDDLWTNVPKEAMEFADYTFADHFNKKPTPPYLPRKDLLNYLVSRNGVDGALDGVKFNHTVLSVKYDGSSNKFAVEVRDDASGTTSTGQYDRCIWAAGLHGTPEKPADVLELLKDYTGTVLHSSEATDDFEENVKGKKILLVGDSSSAEDLALRAVKLGAKHVYISARSGDGEASDTKSWPKEKVTVIFGPPYKVLKGTGFKCQAVYWSEKRQRYRRDDEEDPVKVKDIETVVLCTGYNPNLEILEESLQFDDEGTWEISKGWAMDNNALTISVGSPSPSKQLTVGATCYPDVYRGVLIGNPHMMFLTETYDTTSAFLDLDVNAHLLLAYLMGSAEIPKEKDMLKANQKQLEAEMQIPWFRTNIDPAYRAEVDELPDGHWSDNAEDERAVILNRMTSDFLVKRLARDMKTCNYPVDFGDWKKLSKLGEKFAEILVANENARSDITKEESSWKTFRDADPSKFVSVHTETPACSLPKHWIDLNADKGEDTTITNVK